MAAYKTKVDIVYETLIDSIAKGSYPDGSRLNISQIAKENDMSEIPVREAIRRLESEGYVSIKANQGAVVNVISQENVLEIFQIKGILEGFAARAAVEYLQEAHYKKLREINASILKAHEESDFRMTAQLNVDFHLTMYEVLPQKQLYNMIKDLWKKWTITKSVFSVAPSRADASVREHEDILRLMEGKKLDEVEMAMRMHKFRAGYDLVEQIGKNIEKKDSKINGL